MTTYCTNSVTSELILDDLYEDDIPVMQEVFWPVAALLKVAPADQVICAAETTLAGLLARPHQPHEEIAMRYFAVALINAAKAMVTIGDLFNGDPKLRVSSENRQQVQHPLLRLLEKLDNSHRDQMMKLLSDEQIHQDELVELIRQIRSDISKKKLSIISFNL